MILLQIEHEVINFDKWKASFDTYTELRQKSGMRRFRILRQINNPDAVMIELEFDSLADAEALLSAVQQVWQRVGALIKNPQWHFSELIETTELQPSHL